jgi:hypothetical protein
MNPPEEKELKAMIQLLEDPDEQIFEEIRDRLLSLGNAVVPALESVWENTFNNVLQTRIEDIIQTIQFSSVREDLKRWAEEGGTDLLAGTLLVSRYQYPDMDEDSVRRQIELIRKDVWLEINPNLTAYEKVRVINHILFEVYNFTGNTSNYHAPQNSYINNVLETKRGNPLLLSILYSVIAQGLNIPVYGVNLPEHFILAYRDEFALSTGANEEEAILFYINPFSRREIDTFLKQLKLEADPKYYGSCSNIAIVTRQIRNLIFAYEKLGYPNKAEDLKQLLDILLRVEQ